MKNLLDRLFPLRQVPNISMFYVLTAVYNLWFVAGIWVFIWGRFMTKTEIGISDAITFTIGFLVELPSGVLADFIGRKKAILIGNILLVLGNFGIAFSNSFATLTLCYLVWTVGFAFQSGATEALAYDSVKKAGKENDWGKVIGTSVIILRIASMTAGIVGGILFVAWFRLPYLIFAVSGIIGIIAALRLKEIPVNTTANVWSFKAYGKQIKDGVDVLRKPIVAPVALIALLTSGMAYLYNWGLLRPLTGERFGYTAVTLPILLAVVSVSVIATTFLLIKVKAGLNLEKTIFVATLIYFLFFYLIGHNFSWFLGGAIMVGITICSVIVEQMFSQFINIHTNPEHRATTLSAIALLTKMPYVLLAITLGVLAEKNLLPLFCIYAAFFALIVWIFAYRKRAEEIGYK